jgi:hypothetical protein
MGAASLAIFVTLVAIAVNLFIAGTLAIVTRRAGAVARQPADPKGRRHHVAGRRGAGGRRHLGQFPSSRNDVFVEWSDATAPVALALVALGLLLTRTGWKYDVRGARDVLMSDTRPPVIYLRSFKDDVRSPIGGAFGWWLKALSWFMPVSFEQELAAIMNRLGRSSRSANRRTAARARRQPLLLPRRRVAGTRRRAGGAGTPHTHPLRSDHKPLVGDRSRPRIGRAQPGDAC